MRPHPVHDQKGQSLLELAIFIGIILVMTTGLVINVINGLRDSQTSQNQLQATKLAQEGLDQVKVIKDRNCAVNLSGIATPYLWLDSTPPVIWDQTSIDSRIFKPTLDRFGNCRLDQFTSGESIPGSIFLREINLQGASSEQKTVVSTVSWTDATGAHLSKLSTILIR